MCIWGFWTRGWIEMPPGGGGGVRIRDSEIKVKLQGRCGCFKWSRHEPGVGMRVTSIAFAASCIVWYVGSPIHRGIQIKHERTSIHDIHGPHRWAQEQVCTTRKAKIAVVMTLPNPPNPSPDRVRSIPPARRNCGDRYDRLTMRSLYMTPGRPIEPSPTGRCCP